MLDTEGYKQYVTYSMSHTVWSLSVSNILYDIIYILVMHDSVCTRSNEFSHQINLVMQLQLIFLIIPIHRLRYRLNIYYIPVM